MGLTRVIISFQLWDIAEDKEAIDHVRYIGSPKEAVDELVKYAKNRYSNDNVTVVVIRLRDPPAQANEASHRRHGYTAQALVLQAMAFPPLPGLLATISSVVNRFQVPVLRVGYRATETGYFCISRRFLVFSTLPENFR